MLLLAPVCHVVAAASNSLVNQGVRGALSAIWKISANGWTYGNGAVRQAWITPQVGMAGYSVQVTQTDGEPINVDAGQGVWLPLTADYSWGYSAQSVPQLASLAVQIRRDADLTIVGAATITLETTTAPPPRRGGSSSGLGGPALP